MIDSKTSTTLMRQHAMSVQASRVFASCPACSRLRKRVLRVCSLKCAGKEATNNMYTQAVDCNNNKKTLYDNATLKSSTAKDALVI